MRHQPNHPKKKLPGYKKWPRKYRVALIVSCAILCVGAATVYIGKKYTENKRLQKRIERQNREIAEIEAISQKETREKQTADSIQWANYRDSVAQLPPAPEPQPEPAPEPAPAPQPPRYTFQDVERMVQKVARDNYFASAWQIDQDNWIMHYSSGDGRREKHYLRKFNAYKKTYGPVMNVKSPKTGEFYLASNPNHRYIQEGPCLVYYLNGEEKGRWNHNGHLLIELDTPADPRDEGYDTWEDYYYDNLEDLYLYYGGS